MAGTAEIQQPRPPRGSLWIVRVIALVLLLGLSVDLLATAAFYLRPCVEAPWVKLPMILPAIPYLLILVKLRGRTRKKGLVLAACWGGAVSLVFGLLFVDAATERASTALDRQLLFLVCLLHVLLFVAGISAFRSLPHETTDRRTFLIAFCGTPFLLLLAMAGMVDRYRPPHARAYLREFSAMISLNKIRTASENYASYFQNGYPASLKELGPHTGLKATCSNAGLIEEWLAKGETSGYNIEYLPGPAVVMPVPGCPIGVQSYAVSARPREFERSGCRSFLLDEAGVIHSTYENRAASPSDPVEDW